MKKQTLVWIPVFAIVAYVISGHGGLVRDGIAGEGLPVLYGASLGLCFTLALGLKPAINTFIALMIAGLLSVVVFYSAFSWSDPHKANSVIWPLVYASPTVAIFMARRFSGTKDQRA